LSQPQGGAGEAYHIGIFGKTGSGKSVLAKMALTGYAKHPRMAIFVIDPQGEFSKNVSGDLTAEGFPLNFSKIFPLMKREVIVKSIRNLVVDKWDLFPEILYESPFFERLSIPKGDNRRIACEILAEELKKSGILLENLYQKESFKKAWQILDSQDIQVQFYRTYASRERFKTVLRKSNQEEFFNNFWSPVAELFKIKRRGAITIEELVRQTFNFWGESRPIVIIDLSREMATGLFWNDTVQAIVIKRLLDALRDSAESLYRESKSLNTLVIIDEAHRLAPKDRIENEKQEHLRNTLLDAVRTTRKYGLGWMFISQTLSSLHREIIAQLRIFFFGFGLAFGTEFLSLMDLAGHDEGTLQLYQSFSDPHSALDSTSRQYSFMTIGPVSPLSFSGTPLFFTAFNNPDTFLEVNGLLAPPRKY